MKTQEINKLAEMILASNPNISKLFMTSDGQGFTSEGKADNHQKTLGAKKLIIVEREGSKDEEPKLIDLSVNKLKEAISKIEDVAVLKDLLDQENAKGGDARSTAVEAIQDRLDFVVKDLDVKQ